MASNPKDTSAGNGDRAASANNLRLQVDAAGEIIEKTLIPRNAMGEMIEGITDQTRHQVAALKEQAGELVRKGMPHEQAANTVLRRARQDAAAAAGQGQNQGQPDRTFGLQDLNKLVFK